MGIFFDFIHTRRTVAELLRYFSDYGYRCLGSNSSEYMWLFSWQFHALILYTLLANRSYISEIPPSLGTRKARTQRWKNYDYDIDGHS